MLLVGLVLLLALTLAGPVRGYLAGRPQLARLAAEAQRSSTSGRTSSSGSSTRQADPAYVGRQARERLTYVLPG